MFRNKQRLPNASHSLTTKQANNAQKALYSNSLTLTPPLQTTSLAMNSLCSHRHTPNTMNSTFTPLSFRSPCFKVKPGLQQRQPPQQLEIGNSRTWKTELFQKPIQAALGPNSTGELSNANRKGANLPSSPLSDLIQEFYSSLNEKDSKRLDKLTAPDCVIEDTAYYKPMDAKHTRTYFRRLMEAMGENVKFAIDEVSQGAERTVAVMWHLEWNGRIIPFTKGCSFCICSGNGGALLIRKIHIFDESPIKLGKWALEILNIVTKFLDMFPKIAEGFLKNPEAVMQPFVKLYKFYVEPFILPFLAYYTHFWTYVARGLTMVLHILYNIFKRLM
ncbi:hypothetical protein ACP4OV_001599 [Aristida adscensionis]